MKRFSLLLFFLATAFTSVGQNIFIPDTIFRSFLQNNYPSCMNGDSLDSQCSQVINEDEVDCSSLGISDLTGIEAFVNLEILDIGSNHLTTLPLLPGGLIELWGWSSNLTSLPGLPSTLEVLSVYNNEITLLPELPATLSELNVGKNNLQSIPDLPQGLQYLDCDQNQITQIPSLPTGLLGLYFSMNQVSILPSLPNSLIDLDCGWNLFTELPETLPTNLDWIHCEGLELTSLPDLPVPLQYLYCGYNNLTELPELPVGLRRFHCNDNVLQSLPELPDNIWEFYCFDNELTELPELPTDLEKFWCHQNELTELPMLPSGLEELLCMDNFLVQLPILPPSLEVVRANNNQLSELPELPDGLSQLSVYNNDIHCLPFLPLGLSSLTIHQTNIECLPNETNTITTASMGMPVCSAYNPHNCGYRKMVVGNSYHDANTNCTSEPGEIGLNGMVVESNDSYYAITDSLGNYKLYLDTGVHAIIQNVPNTAWQWNVDCPSVPYNLYIDSLSPDTTYGIDFPNQFEDLCHWPTIDIVSSNHRPCFTTGSYVISYENAGTIGVDDAYIEVQFPPEITPQSSSMQWIDLGNGLYRFDLGYLDVFESGIISMQDSVSCFASLEATACVRAEIFPHSTCLDADPGWDQSSISVEGICGSNSVDFVISNQGSGDMSQAGNYRIFRNNFLWQSDLTFSPLASGSDTTVSIAFDGSGYTYRLEADQSTGHPGNSLPRANVEMCGSEPFSLGQILQSQQDDLDDHIEIDCTELTAAYDPNDKQVIPAGVGPQHIVHPDNELLEYKIRFQNTGNDTAFNIEVVDTLPAAFVSVETFQSGASSDPYTVTMHGNGIVTWHFNDILLPDSNINEPESHGFVKFKIQQKPNLPNGTVISNSAAIYFDYNAPIITNSAFITISDTVMWAEDVGIEEHSQLAISVQPNPFHEMCLVRLDEIIANGRFQVFDTMGRLVHAETFSGNQFQLSAVALENGMYTVRILDQGTVRGNTRVSVLW